MHFISGSVKISVFVFHSNFDISINFSFVINCVIILFTNDNLVFETEVLSMWFKMVRSFRYMVQKQSQDPCSILDGELCYKS